MLIGAAAWQAIAASVQSPASRNVAAIWIFLVLFILFTFNHSFCENKASIDPFIARTETKMQKMYQKKVKMKKIRERALSRG